MWFQTEKTCENVKGNNNVCVTSLQNAKEGLNIKESGRTTHYLMLLLTDAERTTAPYIKRNINRLLFDTSY